MGRKVFISFLGTNNYLQTHYVIEGKKTKKPVRFIQEALADHLCTNWSGKDKILIFYTKESCKKNWDDNGQERIIEDREVEKIGLCNILSKKTYSSIVEHYEIHEGFSEKEVWETFNTVYSKIQNGDELYVDITHAFRSIPLFASILLQYSQFMKGTRIKKVQYGAFEKLGPSYKVKEMALEQRVSPVVDLTGLVQLQELTSIANNFTECGKISGLSLENCDNKRIKNVLAELDKETRKLEDYILTNKVSRIEEGIFAEEIVKLANKIINNPNSTEPQRDILIRLCQKVSRFKKNGGKDNVLAAIEWAHDNNMVLQAYTLAEELIITLGCEYFHSHNPYEDDTDWRLYISSLFAIKQKDIDSKNYEGKLKEHADLTDTLLAVDVVKGLHENYRLLSSNRNILCHAKGDGMGVDKYKEQLMKNFYACKELLYANKPI